MPFKRQGLLYGIGLLVLLMSLGYPLLSDSIFYKLKALGHLEMYLQTEKPVAIHRNPAGQRKDVACVIEPALTNCLGTGFASLLLKTIDDITTCLARGFTPTVWWTDCEYCGPPGANKNYWTWYFEAINPGIEEHAETSICVGPVRYHVQHSSVYFALSGQNRAAGYLVDFRFADMAHKLSSYSPPITAEVRALANHVISGYIKPAPSVQKMVDTFYESFMAGRINIGVHVRLSNDHLGEMADEEQEPPKLEDFLQVTKHIIDDIASAGHGKAFRIFIASDLDEAVTLFKHEFGKDIVVHTDVLRGPEVIDRLGDRVWAHELGNQVLTDILLMSKCDYLVHDESNVASVAYYFNPKLQSHFVSGEVSDHMRLNAKSRDNPDQLFRQAVANETASIRDIPGEQPSLGNTGLSVIREVLSDMEESVTMVQQLACFRKNVRWSKCRKEFAASQFANRTTLKYLMKL